MRWIGVNEGHHSLSHKPDKDKESQDKLIRINKWFCEQLAYLVKKLSETPEPGTDGTLLDNNGKREQVRHVPRISQGFAKAMLIAVGNVHRQPAFLNDSLGPQLLVAHLVVGMTRNEYLALGIG